MILLRPIRGGEPVDEPLLQQRLPFERSVRGTNSTQLLPHFRISRPPPINILLLFVAAPVIFF
jgi:hypothetical protein